MVSGMLFNTLVILIILVLLIYQFLRKRYRYWADKGVPYLEPNLIFGNMGEMILHNSSLIDRHHNLYKQLAPHKFGGYFNFQRPILLIRDPELTKCILTKDFQHFSDHNKNFEKDNEILSHHLFNLTGEKWKVLRSKLTPTFTSGKMKNMFHLMKECAETLSQVIGERLVEDPHLDMKELLARYSTDVIISCAFGIQSNSLKESDAKIRQVGKKLFQPTFKKRLFNIVVNISPALARFFGLRFTDKETEQFFVNLIDDVVKHRENNGITRNDFLNLLMELKKKDENETATDQKKPAEIEMKMTIELMAAQCFVFFIAGFDTSSGVVSHCLLELCKHPEYQEKLREEINDVLAENNGEITYDVLQQMPYMEQVIAETMRLYPSLPILFRQCTKTYRIPDTDVIIEKGMQVFIPVYGIHHDEQYFTNADVFNPDNFLEKNKASRHHFSFLPFGEGPRICIGLRFGQMQVKLALTTLIQHYKFSLSPKMELPVKFSPNHILTNIIGGIWLKCEKC